ncbi:hypothetical protein HYC85_014236 [Camellia sinensis]|uniref:Uncharacterized protein n=1 Tax=Camellia sinensis TaxID=4442 RepID=A0A7J7H5X2_CAMSI|nr:hypothetical protein HYC85_014236 [Camellia sinensis]
MVAISTDRHIPFSAIVIVLIITLVRVFTILQKPRVAHPLSLSHITIVVIVASVPVVVVVVVGVPIVVVVVVVVGVPIVVVVVVGGGVPIVVVVVVGGGVPIVVVVVVVVSLTELFCLEFICCCCRGPRGRKFISRLVTVKAIAIADHGRFCFWCWCRCRFKCGWECRC